MRLLLSILLTVNAVQLLAQGEIRDNTNPALPSSYDFQEYVFPEPDDQGTCSGNVNTTAMIEEVFVAQTHRHEIGHPLFFMVGHRPALLQLAVTGSGAAPDVQVMGTRNGSTLGTLCLKGPANLPVAIDLRTPDFANYFSVTLPKDWVQDGLELVVTAGAQSRTITPEDLKIGPYTELNLVMVNMDVLDYNAAPPLSPIFSDFLQEMASAIPASVVRFGTFPETLTFPEIVASNDTEQMVRLRSRSELGANGITNEGHINSIATLALSNLHESTGDYLSTVYFGNTLNLRPGGWGGGKSFVGFDYTDIFIHELGHALSLPHWGQGPYTNFDGNEFEYLYPYGGEEDNGGGRGEAWNFIQYKNEFVDPECQESDAGHVGKERSDCMQRNFRCVEQRSEGLGPWDGFGDFSAIAIHRYLVGASVQRGQVSDRNQMKDFRLNRQEGFPNMTLEGGERVYTRDVLQPEELGYWERHDLPGEEQLNQQVYLIYGSAHATQAQANIVYKPLRYEGTLPPVIDPTDPATFAQLKDPQYAPYLSGPFDITLKLIYEDGTVTHALNPFHSFARAPYDGWLGIWRWDISNFSLVVPGDKELAKVEMYKRPFTARDASDDIEGNINFAANNITAQNFMDDAVFLAEYEFGRALALGSNTIGNRVWHDLNQDGIQDRNEPGIEGVSLIAWEDSDGDNIPDSRGFLGVRKTDEDGFYSFSGLGPGNYLVFVWSLDNWGEGEPLQGMIPTIPFVEDPNTDLNNDSHGRPGNLEWGLSDLDFVSGQITLTADGEPLNDGDREDDWFDYDPSGNMTIDFGFFVEGANSTGNQIDPSLAKVYPNPGADFIRFETTDYSGRTLSILNAHGQLVLETKLSAAVTPLNVGALPSGVYATVMKNEFGTVIWSANFVKLGR